jgi:hypothetical protein
MRRRNTGSKDSNSGLRILPLFGPIRKFYRSKNPRPSPEVPLAGSELEIRFAGKNPACRAERINACRARRASPHNLITPSVLVETGATRYDYEVRAEKNVFAEVPNPGVPKEMLELAEHILETKAGHFDPKRFKDDYELALRKLEKRKAAGERIEALPPAEDTGKVINLASAPESGLTVV